MIFAQNRDAAPAWPGILMRAGLSPDKGKPVARRGRKTRGLSEVAQLPKETPMSTPLAVVHRSVGLPVLPTSHLAHILFPYAVRAVPSTQRGVRLDSFPDCRDNHGADASVEAAGTPEKAGFSN